jgi:hypothetical protein
LTLSILKNRLKQRIRPDFACSFVAPKFAKGELVLPALSRSEINTLESKVMLTELFELYEIKLAVKLLSSKALCPWCGSEGKPKLTAWYKKGRYRCCGKGCHRRGDHLTFPQD